MRESFFAGLLKKTKWVRRETLLIHKISTATRIASSMSVVEIFVALFYGKILKYKNKNCKWELRSRLIISKGHGAICLYPILADLGFFRKEELKKSHTAVYYFNTNNGATEIKGHKKIKSIKNQIVIFPSKLQHRSIQQTDTTFRWVLNLNYLPK